MIRSCKIYLAMVIAVSWLICVAIASPLSAQTASEAPLIKELSYEQKLARWNSFSEEQKDAFRQKASRMSEKKFSQLKNNFERVRKFEPGEQMRIKENFGRIQRFEPQKQQQVREKFRKFQQLPPERRQQFRKKFIEPRKHGFQQQHRQDKDSFRPRMNPVPRDINNAGQGERMKMREEGVRKFRQGIMGGNQQNSDGPRQNGRWQQINKFRNQFGAPPVKPSQRKPHQEQDRTRPMNEGDAGQKPGQRKMNKQAPPEPDKNSGDFLPERRFPRKENVERFRRDMINKEGDLVGPESKPRSEKVREYRENFVRPERPQQPSGQKPPLNRIRKQFRDKPDGDNPPKGQKRPGISRPQLKR